MTTVRFGEVVMLVSLLSCSAGIEDGAGTAEKNAAEVYAAAICDAMFSCDCATTTYANEDECVAEVMRRFEEEQRLAEQNQLVYDGACLDRHVSAANMDQCRPSLNETLEICQIYHGDVGVGGNCTLFGLWVNTCDQGLFCLSSACTEPASGGALLGEGADCSEPGSLCDFNQNLGCDQGSGTCVQMAATGESCPDGFPCERGSWCNTGLPEPVCEDQLAEGDSCSTNLECESLQCTDDLCVPKDPIACQADRFY